MVPWSDPPNANTARGGTLQNVNCGALLQCCWPSHNIAMQGFGFERWAHGLWGAVELWSQMWRTKCKVIVDRLWKPLGWWWQGGVGGVEAVDFGCEVSSLTLTRGYGDVSSTFLLATSKAVILETEDGDTDWMSGVFNNLTVTLFCFVLVFSAHAAAVCCTRMMPPWKTEILLSMVFIGC